MRKFLSLILANGTELKLTEDAKPMQPGQGGAEASIDCGSQNYNGRRLF